MKKTIIFIAKQQACLILLASAVLVSIWFKDRYILGTAEDGLIFYNISNYFHQAEYTWMEYPGLGSPSLSLIAAKPTYFLLSLLQQQGIPGFLIQAITLWFLLSSAGIAVYLLSKELFPKLQGRYVLLSILFYWFNPISIVDVWNRSLLNYIFFFALLPVATYFFVKGLRTGKLFLSLVLNIVLILYSYAFSYVAFSILLWIWLFLITFFFALFEKDRKSRTFSVKYFILTLILFCIVNIWWILPLISLYFSEASGPTSNLFLKQNNQGSLDALSKSSGSLIGVFKLINTSFLAPDSLGWVKLYYSPLLYVIQYIFVGTILYFIIKFRKDSTVLFLGSLFFISIFLSKGNNPPFGEIYNLIFKNILILQVFRNPFEKFGFLLSLSAALLFSPSIYEFSRKWRNNQNNLYYFLIFIIILSLGFPLYTNLAFTNKFPPTNDYSIGYKVKVPEYYKEVNDWLNNKGNNFRYIGLPIKEEGITYNWEKGYAGVELNVALLQNSGIIHNTSVPFFNQIVPKIEETLLSDKDFSNFANFINVRYYLLRYDIDYQLREMTDPNVLETRLTERERKGEVKKVATFGKVSIWENLRWEDYTFYIGRKISKIDNFDYVSISDGEVLIDEKNYDKAGKISNFQNSGTLSYEKINPTKYILHIKNSTGNFLLVFSELFNPGWKLVYTDNSEVKSHFRVNMYGNGWIVDRLGSFDLILEFAPQKWMDLGEKVSIGGYALMLCVLFLLISKYRKSES